MTDTAALGTTNLDPTVPLLSVKGMAVSFAVGSRLAARIKNEQRFLRAVDGVDLDLGRGEALALVGESVSCKSTFALALAGLRPPDRGEIRFNERMLPRHRSREDQRRIQMVFQDPYSSLNPRLTVGSMLRELIRVHHIVPLGQADEYCKELLTLVGLGPDAMKAFPRQFSGGQRQRVAIARALALRPDILVADEPVSALDVSVQATILNLLRDLRAELGLTLMLISHNLAVVRHLCDRVAVMYLGRIIEVAPTETLFSDPQHPYTRGLIEAIPKLSTAGDEGAPAIAGDPPSPLRIPAGCRFRTRCPIAQERCAREDPALLISAGDAAHSAACHFAFSAAGATAGPAGAGPAGAGPAGAGPAGPGPRARPQQGPPAKRAARATTPARQRTDRGRRTCQGGFAIAEPVMIASERGEVGLAAGIALLRAGASAMDAVEAAVRAVESNEADHFVGVGGLPNLLGEVELDASIMDGATRRAGAVGAVRGFPHPISIARAVCERLPQHLLLVGAGAERFADEAGIERGKTLTDEALAMWRDGLSPAGLDRAAGQQGPGEVAYRRQALGRLRAMSPPGGPWGTVNVIGLDSAGHLAAGGRTRGYPWQYRGRGGDSALRG